MAIFARTLTVRHYRSYASYTLGLDPRVTVLVGRNAQGKTNLIEALQLLTSGTSFRKPAPSELVAEGESACSLALRLEGDGRVVDLGCTVTDGKRSFTRNGKKCPAAGVRGVVPSVLFCPDDLDMVKRSASVRRAALDGFGVQLNEQYAQLLGTYERLVEQRNALLKERWCTRDMLVAWNDALAQAGVLDGGAPRAHRGGADTGAGAGGDEGGACAGAPVPADRPAQAAWWRERFLEALDAVFDDELRRGITLVGPHRDEIRFTVDGRDARAFASQGQQRSLVLAWKVAEVAVTRDILGHPPLLLLDDVMSELDAERREAFMRGIEGEVQTVITTTNLGYFSDAILSRARVVTIEKDAAMH